MRCLRVPALWPAVFFMLLSAPPTVRAESAADSVADFYHGRNVTLLIGFDAGTGYDIYARLIARFMSAHIPGNPNLVPQNMQGAAGIVAANYLYNIAPKDGSLFGTLGRSIAFAPLLDTSNVKYDPEKFNWLGNAGKDILIADAWHGSGIDNLQDLMQKELLIGTAATTSDTYRLPLMLNKTIGTKFKMITGYPLSEVSFAMERGELAGEVRSLDSVLSARSDWLRDHKISILLQTGTVKDARLPDVPLALDYAKTPLDRQLLELVFMMFEMARPYAAPPGVPPERVQALENGLMATLTDPAFLAEAEQRHIDVTASSSDEMTAQIHKAYALPADIITQAKAIFADH